MASPTNTLYVVATPIGNIGDISERAKQIFASVDFVIAEDTRQAGKLMSLLKITPRPKFKSYHAQTDVRKLGPIVDLLRDGKSAAYITDAGTPAISDPGTLLVHETRKAGVKVVPVPGPSAFVTAISGSGLPAKSILFLGFLPKKKGRQTALKKIPKSPHTIVFYESTHRILKTLSELETLLGKRLIAAVKELTKIHENYFFGPPSIVSEQIQENPSAVKGEWVIIIPPSKG